MHRRHALKSLATAAATTLFRGNLDAQLRPVSVAGKPVTVQLATLSASTLRFSVVPRDGTYGDLNSDGALTEFEQRVYETGPGGNTGFVGDYGFGAFRILAGADPIGIRVLDPSRRVVQELTLDDDGALLFNTGATPLLGFGEGGRQFDRRGALDAMRNGQGGYQLRTHGGRVPIQWLIGTEGWGLFIHQPFGTFDLTGARGKLTPSSPLPLDCFLVVSKDPATIMREYARITGLPEMPPLWAFGYQQSHRTLASLDEVMWVAKTMREKKLPCDALIYLGTDFCPSGWNTHNGEFAWNRSVFADPGKAIDDLHALHYKVVLHVVIEGRHLTGTVDDPCTTPERSGRTPDANGDVTKGTWPPERSVGCYWPHHKGVFDLGVDGWWPDQGDGLDAPSRVNRIRMYWDGSQRLRPNERPYALHRNGYAGMARYGAFLWSGDVYSTWETLKTHVPVAVNTGLSGIPFWGTDIGGFVPTPEFLADLYVRWFQFAAFCPLFRAHGRTWHLRLPWGWNTGETGPDETSAYSGAGRPPESELHNPQVEPICRKYLELRYRLMPYLFLWGRDILVAPVVEKDATSRKLYLPRGTWYDFWSDERVEGGRDIDRPVDLGLMPLYVRAGAVVPMGPVKQYTGEQVSAPLTIRVYPGADGAFELFEDDGRSFAYRSGGWTGLSMRWDDRTGRLSVALTPGSTMRGAPRELDVNVAGGATTRAAFSGTPITVYSRR
jgi:alpha-glucosidase/alpha-D-xyloside xylohydrolase